MQRIISCTDPDSSVITSPKDDKMEDIEVKFEFDLDNYVVKEIIPMEDNQFGGKNSFQLSIIFLQ